MSRNDPTHSKPGFGFPLRMKLAVVLLIAAVLMAAFLYGYFGPRADESFTDRTGALIEQSHDALSRMVLKQTADSKELLVNLIRHTTDARRRHMKDLPLSLYAGDVDQIRRTVEETDAAMSRRLEDNVEILAREMEQRSLKEVKSRIDSLAEEQTVLGTAFASDIRRAYLNLNGAVFGALVLMFGFGLYHTVVRPVRQLRQGTQAVARGDLDVEVPVRSADEVGGLAADFGVMVSQLRQSRDDIDRKNRELQDLNLNLEAEVNRKTQQLIHAEKMASIGTLAGGVAHEFNNLMGGIRGCAVESLETETDSERRETIEVILRAADRASEITAQLLRFSRQRAVKIEPRDVGAIIGDALTLIEPDAHKRGVTIVRRIEAGAPVPVDGDGLHQVLLNLCNNALHAMPGGGELRLEAVRRPREMVIAVKDSGGGIAADRIDHIFEPFFTTKDQDPDPAARGAGLGLSVSYSIVEAHGGTIEVDSTVGEGSTFTITLPIPEFSLPDGDPPPHGNPPPANEEE